MTLREEMRGRYVQACMDLLDDDPDDRHRGRYLCKLVAVSVWVVLVCAAGLWLGTSLDRLIAAQPQPRMEIEHRDRFGLLEFPNGSQWYLRAASIQAIHAVPAKDAERLEVQSVIYGTGFRINCPLSAVEVQQTIREWNHEVRQPD